MSTDQFPKLQPRVPFPSIAGKKRPVGAPAAEIEYSTYALIADTAANDDVPMVCTNAFDEIYTYSRVTNNNIFRKYDSQGVLVWQLKKFSTFTIISESMCSEADDGSLSFVIRDSTSASFEVHKYSRDGELVYKHRISTTLSVDQMKAIHGDAAGNIYIGYADIASLTYVSKIDPDGLALWTRSNTLDDDGCSAIYVASTGDVYVSSANLTSDYLTRLDSATGATLGTASWRIFHTAGSIRYIVGVSRTSFAEDGKGNLIIMMTNFIDDFMCKADLPLLVSTNNNSRRIISTGDNYRSFFLDTETDIITCAGDSQDSGDPTQVSRIQMTDALPFTDVLETKVVEGVFGFRIFPLVGNRIIFYGDQNKGVVPVLSADLDLVETTLAFPEIDTDIVTSVTGPNQATSVALRVWISANLVLFQASVIPFTLTKAETVTPAVYDVTILEGDGGQVLLQSEVLL